MRQRIALVTGATGGLGRHLTAKLLDSGYSVRACGRNRETGAALAGTPGVSFLPGDLADSGYVRSIVPGADVVFHCAALSSPWGPIERFRAANVTATRSLVDAAAAAGCRRFVHVSTPAVTFQFRDQLGIREDAALPRQFVNHYAATKAEAEDIVRAVNGMRLATTILRPRGIFGEFDTVLLPRLAELARRGSVPLFRSGGALVDVTYAGNVADAMILCDRADAPPGTYNISNGEPVTVRDLLERVFRALGLDVALKPMPYFLANLAAGASETFARVTRSDTEPRLLRYSLGLMRYSQTLDITAARDKLGYRPRVSIDEGLRRTAQWLAAGRPLWFPDAGGESRRSVDARA